MEIRTPRLTLRPVTADMADAAYRYAGDPENAPMMVYLPYESLEETKQALREAVAQWQSPHPAFYEFGVFKGAEQIGGLTLYVPDEKDTLELAWIIAKDHWGNGYAPEAARGLMDYALKTWGIRRFIALCDSENIASRRTMEKLGMTFVKAAPGRRNRSAPDAERVEWTYAVEL